MKRCFNTTTFTLVFALTLTVSAYGQGVPTPETKVERQKRAQTGMKFLSMSVDPRATAIGGAVTAEMEGSSASLFYNPASMAGMEGSFHAQAGILSFITDINYNVLSAAYRPSGGNFGVIGVTVMSIDYGEFIGTIRANNLSGYVETGDYSPSALSVGVGYARSFSDRFSAGAQVKYAYQDIGNGFTLDQDFAAQTGGGTEGRGVTFDPSLVSATADYSKGAVAFDFGIVYRTGFRSLVIAMDVRNFSQELTYVRERFELPLTFQIGASMNVLDLTSMNPDMHSLTLFVDAQRPRDFQEHVKFGLEYTFMDIISLRGGFEQMVSEEEGVSLGAGLHYGISGFRVGADYAYTDFGLFGDVHRVGLQIGF